MPKKEITTKIDLDLEGIPKGERASVKTDVGEFVVNEISRFLADGNSPVSGEKFKKLSKDYARTEKQGDSTPNLQQEGDMLETLISKNTRSGIKVGHFLKKQVEKSDGHNQHSSEAKKWAKKTKFPKRRYLPDDEQKFKKRIQTGIDSIVTKAKDQFSEEADEEVEPETSESSTATSTSETPQQTQTSLEVRNIFDDDVIEGLLRRSFGRGFNGN